jgi:hypothetical protein
MSVSLSEIYSKSKGKTFQYTIHACGHVTSTLRTFLSFVAIAISSHYQSPVNCRNRNVDGNFAQRVSYSYSFPIPGLEFM